MEVAAGNCTIGIQLHGSDHTQRKFYVKQGHVSEISGAFATILAKRSDHRATKHRKGTVG